MLLNSVKWRYNLCWAHEMIKVAQYSSLHSHSLYKYRVFQSDEAYYSLLYLMHKNNCANEITLHMKTEVFWFMVPCSLVYTGDYTS